MNEEWWTDGERREDFGSQEVTQLPDHVIAERRGQSAAEEEEKSMHVRQRREDEEEDGRTAKGQKKAGDKRGQLRSRRELQKTSAKQSEPSETNKEGEKVRARDSGRTRHLSLECHRNKQNHPVLQEEDTVQECERFTRLNIY